MQIPLWIAVVLLVMYFLNSYTQCRLMVLCFIAGGDESVKEEENEDEYLNLLYDPCLNCYFDPKTGKYYELA